MSSELATGIYFRGRRAKQQTSEACSQRVEGKSLNSKFRTATYVISYNILRGLHAKSNE